MTPSLTHSSGGRASSPTAPAAVTDTRQKATSEASLQVYAAYGNDFAKRIYVRARSREHAEAMAALKFPGEDVLLRYCVSQASPMLKVGYLTERP